jgi:hypothetical protein
MSQPELSVIVLTPDNYRTIHRTLAHLRAQTVRDRLELVIVAPAAEPVDPAFPAVRHVPLRDLTSTAAARAAGVRAATAPVVAFVEEHSFPQPNWAAELIAAHRQPVAGVGPAIVNANPATLTSWANLIIEYGPWLDPAPAAPVEHLPGHNSSYQRDVLLAYGDRLEAMLDAESILHWDLRARGHRLVLAPAAKTEHFNFSRLGSSVPLRFHGGRLFAAARSRHWSTARRLAYGVAAPLIPPVRLARLTREMSRPGRARPGLWRVWPLLFVLLMLDALGEMVGYLTGAGEAMAKLTDMEFHRDRHLTAADRQCFAQPA